jgi:hypothetical protein
MANESALSVDYELTMSRGALLAVGHLTEAVRGGTYVDGARNDGSLSSRALLVGVRSPGNAGFVTAAAGIGHATRQDEPPICNPTIPPGGGCFYPNVGGSGTGLALEAGVHASAVVAGLGARFFTLIGAGKARYSVLALSIDAGWFGRW